MTPDPESAQARITAFWSTVAESYEDHPGNTVPAGSPEYEQWVDVLRSALPALPADVLDLGCGTGFASLVAAGLGHRVTGVDMASPMLHEARSRARARQLMLSLACADAVDPPFAEKAFDAITSRHVLWTLREPERAFGNWWRLLRPGGRLIAVDSRWSSGPGEVEPAGQSRPEGEPAIGIFERYYGDQTRASLPLMQLQTTSGLVAMIRRAGFASVTVTEEMRLQDATARADGRVPFVLVAMRAAI